MALYTPIRRKEHSGAYKRFKDASKEDDALISFLNSHHVVQSNDRVLDVGGRRGHISLAVQSPENVTIVDVDPEVTPFNPRATIINQSIEEAPLDKEYDVIIISHILGDLGYAGTQESTMKKLFKHLAPKGKLVLCFNRNGDFLDDLKAHLESVFPSIRILHDYFDEELLTKEPLSAMRKETHDFVTALKADSFRELATYCWVLFSGYELEEQPVVDAFEKFLQNRLERPEFQFGQRIVLLQRK